MIKKTLKSLALLAAAWLPLGAAAETLLTETFNYPAGNLYGKGGWVQTTNTADPIQVTGEKLSYEGFLEGNGVKMVSNNLQAQDLLHQITQEPLTSGDLYAAMLINVKALPDKYKPFFSFISATSSKKVIEDKKNAPGNYGYICISKQTDNGKFTLGLNKTTYASVVAESQELDLNTTYLIVAHWGYVEGTGNDVFEIWVNPTSTQTSSTITMTKNADPTFGHIGIGLYQQPTADINCQEMLVGPIKVATTWAELFDGQGGSQGGEDPDPTPAEDGEISVAGPDFSQLALYQYQSYPVTVNVKAKDLAADIAVGNLGSSIKASATTIPAAQAMSAEGYDLTLTLNPTTAMEEIDETVTFTAGTATATLPVKVAVLEASQLMNLRFTQTATAWNTYYYNGNVTVTYVDAANETLYVEDQVGGLALKYEYLYLDEPPYKEGDKISKFWMMCDEPSFGVPVFQLNGYYTPSGDLGIATLVSENNVKTPIEATLADLKESPEDYISRLVTVSDLTFAKAGETFSTASTAVTSGSAMGNVRAFSGSDLIGQTIPESATVTGISTSMNAAVLTVRRAADVVAPQAEPALEIEKEILVDTKEYYPMGQTTPFAKLTVTATNLPKPAQVWFGGKQRDSFSADLDEIPAGSGTYTINVTFNPTQTGRNEATLTFDASPTELSSSVSMSCLAYDPQNMPEFSVYSSALTEFTAKPGEIAEQTLTITAKNLLDYGTVRVLGQGQGAFLLNSTTFLKEGETSLKVTFKPLSEGTYAETIEFSTPKAETITVQVSGTCEGERPIEEKQGDELSFDTSAPKAKYVTDFTGCGERNKPLSLDGWKNVAIDGTRAFWAYTDDDNNTMAKVTAYDSQMDINEDVPAEMLLLSPALDFKNSTTRLLRFSLMGDFMTDAMTDQFSVLYIDPTLPESERYQVIGGIDVPVGSDANGEWRPFIVDLEGLDIADTFFIGFHFLSTRGRNTSTVYYVDDFSWGCEDTPFIRVDKYEAQVAGVVGESVKVDDFTVTGLNLTEPIAVAFEGAHKAHFTLSANELPAQGGTLTVNYSPAEEGEHAVYVNLSSTGAPTTSIVVGGTATTSAISSVEAAADSEAIYYNLRGERINRVTPGQVHIRLANGHATKRY
ncbi:MAG: hypothetical protein NC301_02205 [Bacteroides sp.]|nr:hypothetical protein [Bacteroides sp.]MCM1379078.1 hypothetical protein [Bacteroides sp.]MCM1445776.1 hypothetical protein [Prevotella sp.]